MSEYEHFRELRRQSKNQFHFIFMKTKHSAHTMVFGIVTTHGDVMSPFIFPRDLRLNPQAYIKFLEEVVLVLDQEGGC